MSSLGRLLDPASIGIVGLSEDQSKHGGRVLGHLRSLGFAGAVHGINPKLPKVQDVEMFTSVAALPEPPDLVVCAVPAAMVVEVVADLAGVGGLIVFAGGFGEAGPEGQALESALAEKAATLGVRMLGPNSGGIIRPSRGLAASFLTCLDRPADQIRSGRVGVVTQSGGTGSYLHNLAAARGGGLAISVSTGNETDIKLGEAIDAVSQLDEVRVLLALIETVRDGPVFIESVRASVERGKSVVACRIGTGSHAKTLMTTHTGAMAVADKVLDGVLHSLGVVVAETPGEAYEVAEVIANSPPPTGGRTAIVTHSGGIAIHLADLAERHGVDLPAPGPDLRAVLDPLLDHGAANNPLDMGGIMGGAARFSEVIGVFAEAEEYDMVLAVSTAHPPAHTEERVRGLLAISPSSERSERWGEFGEAGRGATPCSVLHLWMAGDQASAGWEALVAADAAVTDEPRAAIRALAGLGRMAANPPRPPPGPLTAAFDDWGVPLVEGDLAEDADGAVGVAKRLGYPVVVKVSSPGLAHKTEIGGVALDLNDDQEVMIAYERVLAAAQAVGLPVNGALVERFRPGLELIVGGVIDPVFGPLVSVGMGGVLTELLGDAVFAPAPVDEIGALGMIQRLRGRPLLDGYRGSSHADTGELARIVSLVSRGLVGTGYAEVEINPLVWDSVEWVAVDWLLR
jgi:acyl-CoA synthetase (NDP forming)